MRKPSGPNGSRGAAADREGALWTPPRGKSSPDDLLPAASACPERAAGSRLRHCAAHRACKAVWWGVWGRLPGDSEEVSVWCHLVPIVSVTASPPPPITTTISHREITGARALSLSLQTNPALWRGAGALTSRHQSSRKLSTIHPPSHGMNTE